MPTPASDRRFLIALLASAFLHVVALLLGTQLHALWRTLPAAEETAPRPLLDARLLPPSIPDPEPEPATDDPLLKNTLAKAQAIQPQPAPATEATPPPKPLPAATVPAPPKNAKTAPKVVHEAQLKLAAHMFYPPAAIEQGLEGEVRILLKLAPDGSILEASIAASSGHPLLDQAGLGAALAMRRVPISGAEELILPVVFKLQ